MKRLAFIVLLALAAAGLRAQELAVASLVQSTMDLSAATSPRLDLNGVPCALVKVLMPAGAEFEGSIIQPVEFRAGEHWVYVTAGTKQMRVKHPSAKPVQVVFADYGIPRLESKVTYTLDVTMPAAAQAQSAASGRNYAVFTVEPAAATVTIDGAPHMARDGKVNVLLRHGAHDYTVEAPGYLPERGSVTVGAERAEIAVRLRSAMGSLSVTSATPGTEIYVNGEKMGTGSWQGELAPGEYLVEGRLASHRPVEQLATLAMSEPCSVTLPALSAITGSLDVNFEPNGAGITIDGTGYGTTPAMIDGLLAGTHYVTINSTGYTPQTHTVTIADSQTATLSGSLDKIATTAFTLCAVAPDGNIVYLTPDDWQAIAPERQRRYKKKGVVLSGNGETFLVRPEDTIFHVNWKKALKYNLPTKAQAEVIAENKEALNKALKAFGCKEMDWWYWTRTESSSPGYAFYINMHIGNNHVTIQKKGDHNGVREVAPMPGGK